MQQHVTTSTHFAGHILDVIITRDTDDTVSNIVITDLGLPDNNGKTSRDHFAIVRDITSSTILQLASNIPDIDKLVDVYYSELESILDKHATLRAKPIYFVRLVPGSLKNCIMPNISDVCSNGSGGILN
jgi:hypothetical protein